MQFLKSIAAIVLAHLRAQVRGGGRPMDSTRRVPLTDRVAHAWRRFVSFAKSALIGFFGTILVATTLAVVLIAFL